MDNTVRPDHKDKQGSKKAGKVAQWAAHKNPRQKAEGADVHLECQCWGGGDPQPRLVSKSQATRGNPGTEGTTPKVELWPPHTRAVPCTWTPTRMNTHTGTK